MRLKKLITERNISLLNFFKTLPEDTLDPEVIIGGILNVLEKGAINPEQREVWRHAGITFLRKHRRHTKNHKEATPLQNLHSNTEPLDSKKAETHGY